MTSEIKPKPGGISIHAVDVANGIPAEGLRVRLIRLGNPSEDVASGACASDGQLHHPVADGSHIVGGFYRVEFEVGAYYRDRGVALPDPAFLDVAAFEFGLGRVQEHFHLPFKFTPWGYSLFRGGA